VGFSYGAITSCYSTGPVSGEQWVGGLVGGNFDTITSCYSSGSVSGDDHVGGLVGENDKGTIASSFWNVETSGQSDNTDGIGLTTTQMLDIDTFLDAGWDFIGETTNGAEETWFMPTDSPPGLTWSQEGYTTVPEVLGMTEQQAKDTLMAQGLSASIIYQFDNTVSGEYVILQDYEGGRETLIGTRVSLLIAFAFDGSGTEEDPYRIDNARRLITLGDNPSFYDKDFVLCADIDLSGYAFERAVIAPDVNDDDSGYQGNEFTGSLDGQGYVISHLEIKGVDYLGLFGCCASDARISNLGLEAVDVNSVGEQVGALVANNSGAITSCYVTGSISGNYSTGRLVERNGEGEQVGGLVGGNSGTILSCYSAGAVTGQESVSGLVGRNSGTITSCHATGPVSGVFTVGGLAGDNSGTIAASYSTGTVGGDYEHYRRSFSRVGGLVGGNSGTITASYSTGSVGGDRYSFSSVGGLAGYNRGEITSSYSTGIVNGDNDIGGLVGANSDTIMWSYSTGAVSGTKNVGGLVGRNSFAQGRGGGTILYGTIASSFWDIETSGQPASDGGTGLTAAEMQTPATFLEAGWDFVGETANGTEDIWWMPEGDYPRLWWELVE